MSLSIHLGTGDGESSIYEGNKHQENKTHLPKLEEERDTNFLMESNQLSGKIRIKTCRIKDV